MEKAKKIVGVRKKVLSPEVLSPEVLHPDFLSLESREPVRGHGVRGPESGDDFVFELNGKRTQFSDKELLGQVRAFAERVGRAFTMEEFNGWRARKCAANCILKRFGSWRRALGMVGVYGVRGGRYRAEELIENLERVWREIGRAPGQKYLRRYGRIGPQPYTREWGSLRRACAEFVKWKQGRISREELLRGRRGRQRGVRASVRWKVLERDGERCRVCGRGAGRGVKLEVDHIVPVSRGGGDEMSNLRVLCGDCNRGKGNQRARSASRRPVGRRKAA